MDKHMRKKMAQEVNVSREKALSLDELGAKEIELPGKGKPEDAAFMEEILEVRVATSPIDPAPVYTGVNGISQYFVRGVKQKVKRKYVEALGRARTYVYEQVLRDSNDPSSLQMIERAVLPYPFEILHDPNPKGKAWLERIIAQ